MCALLKRKRTASRCVSLKRGSVSLAFARLTSPQGVVGGSNDVVCRNVTNGVTLVDVVMVGDGAFPPFLRTCDETRISLLLHCSALCLKVRGGYMYPSAHTALRSTTSGSLD